MATIQDGDILRITCKMHCGASQFMNVYHMKYTGTAPIDGADATDLINEFIDYAYTFIDQCYDDSFKFDTIEIFDVTQDLPVDEVPWYSLVNGGDNGAMLPYQLSELVVFGTDAPRCSGRKFLPAMLETKALADGVIDSATLATIAGWAANLLAGVVFPDGAGTIGAWSKKYSRFAPFLVAVVDDLFRTQRRRVPGVGS
jgi:hypothetical protein